MSFFKNLFGTNTSEEAIKDTVTNAPEAPNMDHLQKIFSDDQPPVNHKEDKEKEQEEKSAEKEGHLKNFLNTNYYDRGFQDGYTYHSMDIHNARVNRLISEYLEIVEMTTSIMNAKVTEFKMAIKSCQVAELEEQAVKLGHKAEDYLNDLDKLKSEKDLAPCKQGLIAKPLSLYKEGFIRGMSQYNEEKLFAGPTGLFN